MQAISRLRNQSGFRDYPERFQIHPTLLGRAGRQEGFATVYYPAKEPEAVDLPRHLMFGTRPESLYVDFETSQTVAYGDTLSWTEVYRPHLGERAQTVVLEVDRALMEADMRELYMRPLGKR